MTPATLAIIERALTSDVITSEEAEQASEELGELRRRDWDVRVLDAFRLANEWEGPIGPEPSEVVPGWYINVGGDSRFGATADEARHAAALAVWPTLSAEVRARIGECP